MDNTKTLPFKGMIGQDAAKREMNFYLTNYQETAISPNLLFKAPMGQGKTKMATEYAKNLHLFKEGKPVEENGQKVIKPFAEINCAGIKKLSQFFNGVIVPYVNDKDVTIFMDEAHKLSMEIQTALLTILAPNETNKTTYSYEDYVADFDFSRQTWLFATSEPQGLLSALKDRLDVITFEEYKPSELAQMLKKYLNPKGLAPLQTKSEMLDEVASVLRGNARAAVKMSSKILAYLKGKRTFVKADWDVFTNALGIHPLGLNAMELQVLRVLKASPDGASLTHLAAKTGMSRDAIQKDVEMFLQKNNLMTIETKGRQITPQGLTYLKQLPS